MKSRTLVSLSVVAGYGFVVAGLTLFGAETPAASGADRSKNARVELGRLLFWDPVLSGPEDVACATCHHPDFAYTDGRALSLGTGSHGLGPNRVSDSQESIPVVKRNSPTVLNVVYNGLGGGNRGRGPNARFVPLRASADDVNQTRSPMFWDSRVRSLEDQMMGPLTALEEMRGDTYPAEEAVDRVVTRLRDIPEYVMLFRDAYGPDATIDRGTLADALTTFERSLVAHDSPYDRYLAGDTNALTQQQQRGMNAFARVGCINCHRGPMLSDFQLHTLGVPDNPQVETSDTGAGRYRFRTPSLRNVALTAPYMHNGTFSTLREVVAFYNRGRSENPNVANGRGGRGGRGRGRGGPVDVANGATDSRPPLDRDFQNVRRMSPGEQRDIVAFLGSLTDRDFDRTIPAHVPSGLSPGGSIAGR